MPCKLTPEQQSAIPGLVEKGPEAFGFAGGVWTRQRLAEVIAETFEVGHKVSSIGLLLKKIASAGKNPSGVTLDSLLKRWRTSGTTAYPPVEPRPNKEDRAAVHIDESAVYFLPHLTRTWAPRGQPPVIETWDRYQCQNPRFLVSRGALERRQRSCRLLPRLALLEITPNRIAGETSCNTFFFRSCLIPGFPTTCAGDRNRQKASACPVRAETPCTEACRRCACA